MKYFLIVTLLFLTCSSNSLKWNTKQLLQKQKTIYIIPLNGVNQNDVLLSSNELQNFYHYNVIVLTQDVIPSNIKSQTSGKYNANKILKFLGEKYGYLGGKIVGITNVNISTKRTLNDVTYNDWSILGLGAIGGQSCIISTKNMITNHNDRLSKVTIHEVGHTLGLAHCDYDPKCLMNDAKGKASKVDSEEKIMCNQCKNKLGLTIVN
jgi:archaemetzincin